MSNPIDPRSFFHDGNDEPPENIVPIAAPAKKFEPPPTKDDINPPPHAVGVEKSVLSVVFQYPERLADIEPDLFHLPSHREIVAAMRSLTGAFEFVSFTQHLLDRGLLDRVGGPSALADILTHQPSPSHFTQHLALLREKRAARHAITQARLLIEEIEANPGEAGEIIAKAADTLKEIRKASASVVNGLEGVMSTEEILAHDTEDDPDALIGYEKRFLCRSGSFLIAAPSGIGKSTLITGLIIHAAAGVAWHGIKFRRPMRCLVIQAENDKGDLSEMAKGAFHASGLTMPQVKTSVPNIKWRRLNTLTGEDFCKYLEAAIIATQAEIVQIDPLMSYIGDDIASQKVCSHFLRNCLQPVLDRTGAIAIIVHHGTKTPTDSKSREGWSDSDFSYYGFGSSEITNWTRASAVFLETKKNSGKFKFLITKRGNRAGMIDAFTKEHTSSIILEHSGKGLGWVQAQPDDEEDAPSSRPGAKPKITPTDILNALKDGNATRRDVLTIHLADRHGCSQKSVTQKIDMLILDGSIYIHSTEKRARGGYPIEFLALKTQP